MNVIFLITSFEKSIKRGKKNFVKRGEKLRLRKEFNLKHQITYQTDYQRVTHLLCHNILVKNTKFYYKKIPNTLQYSGFIKL